MQRELEISIPPALFSDQDHILQQGAKALQMPAERIQGFLVRKRSIDARAKQVVYRLRVVFFIDEPVRLPQHVSTLKNVR
ncbi:MAG: FAD-binding protein, partial [Sphingobacteriaceae bacterium]